MKSPSIGYVVRLCCQTLDLSLTLDSIKSQKVRDHQSDICSHSFVLVLVLNTKISYLSQDKLLCVILCFLYFRKQVIFHSVKRLTEIHCKRDGQPYSQEDQDI